MAIENKSTHITARCSPSAKQVIERAADAAGMRLSAWVAKCALVESQRELQRELERLHQASLEAR